MVPKNLKIEILQSQGKISNIDAVRKDGMHHIIFRVTLTNGEQYAVDLAGAQYGYHKECLTWQDYSTSRIEKVIEIGALGATKKALADDTEKKGYPANRVQELNISFAKEMWLCVQIWTRQEGSLDAMLALPEKYHMAKRTSLLELVERFVTLSRQDSIRQGSWCRR